MNGVARIVASQGLTLAVFLLVACMPTRSLETPEPNRLGVSEAHYPQNVQKEVDILFVVDNSGSMRTHQQNLVRNFPKLIEALRSEKLGGRIPNVRIGVVSSDSGTIVPVGGCSATGDDGMLQLRRPEGKSAASCPLPTKPWISYDADKNVTNVPSTSEHDCDSDPIGCVKQAFSCMAELGTDGCGIEASLESAARALDGRNEGFLREKALLAVVFITDEDDCSVKGPGLFQDPDNKSKQLGPLGYRCFAHGFDCDTVDPQMIGPRKECKPNDDYLKSVSHYVSTFEALKKDPGQLIFAAISGPSSPIEVARTIAGDPHLEPSCRIDVIDDTTGRKAGGAPALRLNAVVEALDGQLTAICESDFGPALKTLGHKIVVSLGGQCVRKPLRLQNGGFACHEGVEGCRMPSCGDGRCDQSTGHCLDAKGAPTEAYCGATCLDKVECTVDEHRGLGDEKQVVAIERCPREFFLDASLPKDACGEHCPCWRIVPRGEQCTSAGASPFGFEVMRKGDAPPNTVAAARCSVSPVPWTDPSITGAAAHCVAPDDAQGNVGG